MNLPLVRWGRPQGDDPPLGRIPDAFGTTTAPLFQAPAPPALQRVQATAHTTKKSFWAVHHGPAAAFGYRSSFILGPSPPSLGPSLAHLGPSSRDLGPSSAHLGPSSRDLGPSSARSGPSSRDRGPRPMRVRTIYTRYRCTGRQPCWRSTALGLLGLLAGVHSGGRRPEVVRW